jgi:NAD(P)-dependent dehydrogenase (short-subunit alcohol dehydrogenase family)
MPFPDQFKNKVVALTGAASGIGYSAAHLLASRGASLSLADLQEEALNNTKASIEAKYPGTNVLVYALDVRNYNQVEGWIAATVSHFGALNGCANLAGVIPKSIGVGLITDQDFDEWDFVLDVNLKGVMHCLKAQLAVIAQNGSVVNASSIAGLTGREKNGSYTASKHAVLGLSRTAAKEFGPLKGVRVNAICP